jgi:hypothetical protein
METQIQDLENHYGENKQERGQVMLKPLLVIGIGGSGGKTVRAMKQALTRNLDSARYKGGIPAAWQFLQIDTTYDGVDFPAPMLPKDEVHLVVPAGATFDSTLASIVNTGTASEQQQMMAGWGIPYSEISIESGAGMMRGIGRQVGVADSAKTLSALQNSIAKMNDPGAFAELASLARALGCIPPSTVPQAFIISSLAGGSGAGMFMDVAELLKRATMQGWASEAISFLYTAEVFNSLGDAGANVSKNSLGAMNELMSSKWVGISQRTELLYSKLGLVTGNSNTQSGYGCKGNILVGARNKSGVDISKGADGAGMDEVFLTIGEALAGAVTNDTITQFLFQQAFVNITQMKSAMDTTGLTPEAATNPTLTAAGIGFGQMTLGADRIVEYVGDAMTKRQVEKLLWPELTPALLVDGKTSRELIQDKSDEIWVNFLSDSNLNEKGTSDQVLDALLPENWMDSIRQFVSNLLKSNISTKAVQLKDFSRIIWSDWSTNSEGFLEASKKSMNEKAIAWVPGIQVHLQDLIANEIMLNGYAVTTNLVERLEDELREHVLKELIRDHQDFAKAVSSFDEILLQKRIVELAEGLTGVSSQNVQFLEKFSSSLVKVLEYQIKSHVNALAASLIQEMLSFFFAPLKKQLTEARHTLYQEQKELVLVNGSKNPFHSFPDWGSGIVSARYKARTIERILIDSSEYESTYELYANKDTGGTAAFQNSVSSSLLGKKMNPMPGDPNKQKMITNSSPWITGVRDAQDKMGAAVSRLEWSFDTGLKALSERNRRWLKDEDSSFGKFTNMSISEFVNASNEGPEIRDKREIKFEKEYEAMLSLAQPLVLLNEEAMNHVVAASDGRPAKAILLKSSRIPFDIKSRVGIMCTQVLERAGFDPKDASFEQDWFNAGEKSSSMFAVATTQASLPAWAFASLTEPILEQIAQSRNKTNTWLQFWEGRRTRPLPETIPFSTELRRSMTTGWFIATVLGMRTVDALPVGRSVKIWNPTLEVPGWSDFPSPLLPSALEDTKRESWVLPQLFTSAGIALAAFGRTGDFKEINGYRLLKYLGREVTTQLSNRDQWDGRGSGDILPTGFTSQSSILKDWIETGVLPGASLEPQKTLKSFLSSNSDRSTALKLTIEQFRNDYNSLWKEFSAAKWHKIPETWELKDDIELALTDIIDYIDSLHITSSITSD